MRIFLKGNEEERNIADLLQKLMDNEYFFNNIFYNNEKKLVLKMIKELENNLKDEENSKYDPAIQKKRKYIDLLMKTKTWGAYLHFYTMEEKQLLNDMINEFQSTINSQPPKIKKRIID